MTVVVVLMASSTAFIMQRYAGAEREAQIALLQASTRALALAVTVELRRLQATAVALAGSHALSNGDWQNFYSEAKAATSTAPEQYVVVYEISGKIVLHTGIPFGLPLPTGASSALLSGIIRTVVETGRLAISNFLRGTGLGKPVVAIYVPVFRDGELVLIMAFGFVPYNIQTILVEQRNPQGWLSVVSDRNGILIARDSLFSETLGKTESFDFSEATRHADDGVAQIRDREGVSIRLAFEKLPRSGWTVGMGIPVAELYAPLIHSLWLGAATVAVASCLAITFAFLYGRQTARPVLQLSTLAAALGRGEHIPAQHLNLREAQTIADQMCIAGAALQQRAREVGQLTAALGQRASALEVANRELEGFSYSTSHVLRAPLRAIDGFSAILLEEHSTGLDAEGQRLVGVLRSAALELSEQIDGILEFLRLGRDKMSYSTVDMAAAVQLAVAAPELQTRDRNLKIEVSPLPNAFGDVAMVRRVWSCLLDNAVKFSASKPDAKIEVGALCGEVETVYFVRDNGVGFDMKYAGKLFGVFNRLHGADFPGNGTGLAIVQRIVSRHGGRAWAEGKPDAGATFYFSFPTMETTNA